MKKIAAFFLGFTFFSIILLPGMFTMLLGPAADRQTGTQENPVIPADEQMQTELQEDTPLLSGAEPVQELPKETMEMEAYLLGVVGAEMPALFETEALKAQAVAARTYAYRQAGEGEIRPDEIGQAYLSEEGLREKWGSHYDTYSAKIKEAVEATRGQILMYEDEPILAVFHAESAGRTENAENVWGTALPYLTSVDSRADENAPGFETEKRISIAEVMTKLQKEYPDIKLTQGSLLEQTQVVERTDAGYVKAIQFGNKMLTGQEARGLFGLRSSNFTLRQEGEDFIFVTRGYGHGAGMSQYGANYMAQDGASYQEILEHYYPGSVLKNISN